MDSDVRYDSRVVFIDDEVTVRKLVKDVLEPYSLDLDMCSSVNDARKIDFDSVDLIVSDYEIGLESGDNLYEEVRDNSNVPFIFFTSRSMSYIDTDIEADDNAYYLEKTPENYSALGDFVEQKLDNI
jgi:DNA-binding NtrC family response regulator